MSGKIRLIHNSYFDEDIDDYKIVKVIIDFSDGNKVIKYQYITADDKEIKEKVIEEKIDNSIIDEISKVDLSSFKKKNVTNVELESWEVEINNKSIMGTYDNLPREIFDLMKKVDFFNIVNGGIEI